MFEVCPIKCSSWDRSGIRSKALLTAGFIYLFTTMNLLGMKSVDAWAEVKSIRWTAMEKY